MLRGVSLEIVQLVLVDGELWEFRRRRASGLADRDEA
jgi:hypothetical protein